jgi:dolichol-phosphate mannosyltransferase
MNKTLVFFATYNEVGNVASMIEQISLAAPDADIFIIDDNSNDGTLAVLEDLKRDNLTVLVRPSKLGLGSAHLLAWKHAIQHHYDVLVTMDGDLSHDPADIPRLTAKLAEGYDLVIGSRYTEGGACDYTGYRRYVSILGNVGARLLLGIRLSEFTTSYRAFRISTLQKIDFATVAVNGYSFFLTVIVQAYLNGLRLKEIPIYFHERNSGASKIPPLEIFRGMSKLLQLAYIVHIGKPKS